MQRFYEEHPLCVFALSVVVGFVLAECLIWILT